MYVTKTKSFEKEYKTNFGKLAKGTIDSAGEETGRWYSVDSNGQVRTHMIILAGPVYMSHRRSYSSTYTTGTRSAGRSGYS
jgi:hypothetical protein